MPSSSSFSRVQSFCAVQARDQSPMKRPASIGRAHAHQPLRSKYGTLTCVPLRSTKTYGSPPVAVLRKGRAGHSLQAVEGLAHVRGLAAYNAGGPAHRARILPMHEIKPRQLPQQHPARGLALRAFACPVQSDDAQAQHAQRSVDASNSSRGHGQAESTDVGAT